MAYWIIDDYGFSGQYFECSNCGERYWDILRYVGDEECCPNCHEKMEGENVYL